MNGLARRTQLIRVALGTVWIGVMIAILTLPSDIPAIDSLSQLLGGTEAGDAMGHVIVFTLSTLVVRWMLSPFLAQRAGLALSIAVVGTLGLVTELRQLDVPYRGASALDLAANCLGVAIAGAWVVCASRIERKA